MRSGCCATAWHGSTPPAAITSRSRTTSSLVADDGSYHRHAAPVNPSARMRAIVASETSERSRGIRPCIPR